MYFLPNTMQAVPVTIIGGGATPYSLDKYLCPSDKKLANRYKMAQNAIIRNYKFCFTISYRAGI